MKLHGKIFVIGLIIIIPILVLTVIFSANASWFQFQHDERHTGQSETPGPTSSNVKWEFAPPNSPYVSNPVVGPNGVVYVGFNTQDENQNITGKLYAVNTDGTLRWESTFLGGVPTHPALITDDLVMIVTGLVGTPAYKIYAFEDTGQQAQEKQPLWEFVIGKEVRFVTKAQDNTLYLINRYGFLFSVTPNHTQPQINWQIDLGGRSLIKASPAVDQNGIIYVVDEVSASQNSRIFAINSQDGSILHSRVLPSIDSSPSVLILDDGTIIIGLSNRLRALNTDLSDKFNVPYIGDKSSVPILLPNGNIAIVTDSNNTLHIINPQTEQLVSSTPGDFVAEFNLGSAPVVDSEGIIYLTGSTDPTNRGLDVKVLAVDSQNPQNILFEKDYPYSIIDKDFALGPNGTLYVPIRYREPPQFKSIYKLVAIGGEPPTLSNLNQYKSDGITIIPEEGTTTEDTIIFKARVESPEDNDVKLQVELRQSTEPFTGNFDGGIIESNFVLSGSTASITRDGLIDAEYHWRARVVDTQNNTSDWQEFKTAGNVDFEIIPLGSAAADLAKELANHPEAYLWAGKGWDYDLSQFVTSQKILSGYTFYNPDIKTRDTGIGVDCSGLITWAFNRTVDPFTPASRNFVKYVNADGLHNGDLSHGYYQSHPVEDSELDPLNPGDALFFDWGTWNKSTETWSGIKDGYMDHVAMYVGESDGFDVVDAANRIDGIRTRIKDTYSSFEGFVDFGRIHKADKEMEIIASSPINIELTDPEGFTITPNSIIESEEEYIREIPGELYYTEIEKATDGNPVDRIYSPVLKTGDYLIKAIPEANALATDTYSLTFTSGNQTILLAQDKPIAEIPQQQYILRTDENGTIEKIIPLQIRIEPETLNLNQKGVFKIFLQLDEGFGFDLEDISLSSVLLEGVYPARTQINKGKNEIILKFNTTDLTNISQGEETQLKLTGNFINGIKIEGTDTVRIIIKGKPFLSNLLDSLSGLIFKVFASLFI